MGCCLCHSQSGIVEDPDVFHTEAKLIVASTRTKKVLLYIKNNKLYQASSHCGLLCCRTSKKLSGIRNIDVVTGTVNILHHSGKRVLKVHQVNLGLRIRLSNWRGQVRIYDTPDAEELARLMAPSILGEATIAPTRVNLMFSLPTPEPVRVGGGGGGVGTFGTYSSQCGTYSSHCH